MLSCDENGEILISDILDKINSIPLINVTKVDSVDNLKDIDVKVYQGAIAGGDRGGVFIYNEFAGQDDTGIIFSKWVRTFDGPVQARWFEDLQTAVDVATGRGVGISGEKGREYTVDKINIKNGLTFFDFSNSTIIGKGTTNPIDPNDAVINVLGTTSGNTKVTTLSSLSVNMDMRNGDTTAITIDGAEDLDVNRCTISNFKNDTMDHRGLRLYNACKRCNISNNNIVGIANPSNKGLLLEVWCDTGSGFIEYGGFFDGAIRVQPNPTEHINVSNNTLVDGSYAINMQGASFCNVSNNICVNQNHRGIYIANGSYKNSVTGNTIENFLSSAILCGYGAISTHISGNTCKGKQNSLAEAAINITTGSPHTIVQNNLIESNTNYGVYIATDSYRCTVSGNDISGHYLAGIFVENDWLPVKHVNNIFARPNYGVPAVGNKWSFVDMKDIVISGNSIRSSYDPVNRHACAIGISSVTGPGNTSVSGVRITGNTITMKWTNISSAQYSLAFFTDRSSIAHAQISLIGNTIDYEKTRVIYNSTTIFNDDMLGAGIVDINGNSLIVK